jgi:uncharacterized protein
MASQTNTATEILRTLHRILRQLSDLRVRLRRGPQLTRASEANVARVTDELVALREAAKKARMASDAKQNQLRSSEEKISKLQIQLNMAENDREYQLLKEQLAATKMVNSVLADEILEGLERLDEFAREIAEAETQLQKAQAQAAETKTKVDKDRPSIDADLARLEAELGGIQVALPDDFKPIYDRAVKARGDEALAPVQGEYCSGCNHKVPLNDINKLLMTEAKPLVCRACGRMLYVPEEWAQEK